MPSFRIRATNPPNYTIFNNKAAIDLTWLNNKPVFHVVDTATNFNSNLFLQSELRKDICKDLIDFCTSVYIPFHEIIRLQIKVSFTSENIRENGEDVELRVQSSGI